jgi:Zn-dependent protease with chaperone function
MLKLMLKMYYPFVFLVILASIGMTVLCGFLWKQHVCFVFFFIILLLVSIFSFVQSVMSLRVFFQKPKKQKQILEIKLNREFHGIIHNWVDELAEKYDLTPPDEIRLSADALAHVYESDKKKNTLVLGGMAIGTLTKDALGGIVAHELAHFTQGDTSEPKKLMNRVGLMSSLEYSLGRIPGYVINPVYWVVIGYHRLFLYLHFKHSREQEFKADEWSVNHAGKEVAAATLIFVVLSDYMPWVRLSSVVMSFIESDLPVPKDIFEKQLERAKTVPRSEWDQKLKKALSRRTRWTDSHPCLKDRLKAIGVSPKRALDTALSMKGDPASNLLMAWSALQRDLSERLTYVAYKQYSELKELVQIYKTIYGIDVEIVSE